MTRCKLCAWEWGRREQGGREEGRKGMRSGERERERERSFSYHRVLSLTLSLAQLFIPRGSLSLRFSPGVRMPPPCCSICTLMQSKSVRAFNGKTKKAKPHLNVLNVLRHCLSFYTPAWYLYIYLCTLFKTGLLRHKATCRSSCWRCGQDASLYSGHPRVWVLVNWSRQTDDVAFILTMLSFLSTLCCLVCRTELTGCLKFWINGALDVILRPTSVVPSTVGKPWEPSKKNISRVEVY